MIYQTIDCVRAAGLGKWAHLRCQCEASFELVTRMQSNGIRLYRLKCTKCKQGIGGAIAHGSLPMEVRNQAIPCGQHLFGPHPSQKCDRCGEWKFGVERHHWAPRNFFADACEWPTSLLCTSCHRKWHKVMREQRRVSDEEQSAYWDQEAKTNQSRI